MKRIGSIVYKGEEIFPVFIYANKSIKVGFDDRYASLEELKDALYTGYTFKEKAK